MDNYKSPEEDRTSIPVENSRKNRGMVYTLIVVSVLAVLSFVIFKYYFKDSNDPTLNKKQENTGVSPGDVNDEMPEYDIVDEKNVADINIVTIHTEAEGEKAFKQVNDILLSKYRSSGNFILYYFRDKKAAEDFIKDRTDELLLNDNNPASGFSAKMTYKQPGDKVLLMNERGNWKQIQTYN